MNQVYQYEEKEAKSTNGMIVLVINTLIMLMAAGLFIFGCVMVNDGATVAIGITLIVVSCIYLSILGPILYAGLKILKPNEALVLTLFGTYFGTLKGPGFFFVNPLVSAVAPASLEPSTGNVAGERKAAGTTGNISRSSRNVAASKKITLKAQTLSNDKQKVNDVLGNPIIISIVVIWKVVNTAKAVFNVDNFTEYLSIQCDSALRNIVLLYPYDTPDEEEKQSLRGSSQEIAETLKKEIQSKVDIAGLEILEARITHLSYAPEIASAMLQRQQASAVIAARQMIVEGAVGMVEMALEKLNENHIVDLDEERKAAMVSNLLVVLCANREAQPIVNSGSIY